MSKKIYIISWPSGVGKTTIWKILVDMDDLLFEKVITTTTRCPREGESYGVHYYFVEKEKFSRLIEQNRMIEYAIVHGNYYWSSYEELDRILDIWKIPLYIVDPQWAKFLKDKLIKDYDVSTIFLMPPSEDELVKRLNNRWTETQESFDLRLKESLDQIKDKDFYDYTIINDDIDKTIDEFISIIKPSS